MGIYTNYPDSIYDDGAGGGGGDVGAPYLKNIMSTTGVKVVDENGYIGGDFLGVYYPSTNYYNNFAVVIPGADYSNEGLGRVTFVTTTTTIGGRVYRTVTIGGVTWMAENLDYKFSGCGIGGSGLPTTPNAWYYNNDEATYGFGGEKECGLLYNWHAVKLLNDNRSELIPGWHVPSYDEWNALIAAVGGRDVAGARLKSLNGAVGGSWPKNWDGTDDYGFGILPGGFRYNDFGDISIRAYFWTITSVDARAYSFNFDRDSSIVDYIANENTAYSVRLVKDP